MPTYQLFATTPKAMETILTDELRALGISQIKATMAGVAFQGDLETAYRACLWSRTANRILLVLSSFTVKSQQDLYDGVQAINWDDHLASDGSFAVSFSAKNSPAINNTHFGALKVKDAIVDQMRAKFNQRPNIDTERPNIRINVYLQGETAQLSLDLSGESLHRRGYRDVTIKAPIKENLAATQRLARYRQARRHANRPDVWLRHFSIGRRDDCRRLRTRFITRLFWLYRLEKTRYQHLATLARRS